MDIWILNRKKTGTTQEGTAGRSKNFKKSTPPVKKKEKEQER